MTGDGFEGPTAPKLLAHPDSHPSPEEPILRCRFLGGGSPWWRMRRPAIVARKGLAYTWVLDVRAADNPVTIDAADAERGRLLQ